MPRTFESYDSYGHLQPSIVPIVNMAASEGFASPYLLVACGAPLGTAARLAFGRIEYYSATVGGGAIYGVSPSYFLLANIVGCAMMSFLARNKSKYEAGNVCVC